jgi:hypothetical protein
MTSDPGAQPPASAPGSGPGSVAGGLAIPPASIIAASGTQLIAAGVVLLAAIVAVFWTFFATQVKWAFEEPSDWGHTLLVPGIAGYFVWLRREELLASPMKAN